MAILRLMVCLGIGLGGLNSAKAEKGTSKKSKRTSSVSAAAAPTALRIVNPKQEPIGSATLTIGSQAGVPFADNVLSTNANGEAAIPSAWTTALPLTIEAVGYMRTTIYVAMPQGGTYEVGLADGNTQLEVKGSTDGFGNLRRDGKVDFGLVVPTLTRKFLLHFDSASVISPESDEISLMGKTLKLPSNLTLPMQTETYILPIQLNKPDYRSFIREAGDYRFVAIHGRFPLNQVVDDLRAGKSVFEVINHFEMLEYGKIDVKVEKSIGSQNINVSQIKLKSILPVTAPNYDPKFAMVSVGLAENNSRLYPTDLKRLMPNQSMNLVTLDDANVTKYKLSMLIPNNGPSLAAVDDDMDIIDIFDFSSYETEGKKNKMDMGQISFVLQDGADASAPAFLANIPAPVVSGNSITLSAPAAVSGVAQAGSYLQLSQVEKAGQVERRTQIWELWSPTWINHVDLPSVALKLDPSKKYRWEVLYLGQPANAKRTGVTIEDQLRSVTHVTRNSVAIQ